MKQFFKNTGQLLALLLPLKNVDYRALSISILVAAALWMLNELNKKRDLTIRFPIEISFNNNKFVPLQDLPTNFEVRVQSSGWAFLRYQAGLYLNQAALEATIDLENYGKKPNNHQHYHLSRNPKTGHYLVKLDKAELNAAMLGGMPKDMVVQDILNFSSVELLTFDRKARKSLEIKLNPASLRLSSNYDITSSIQIDPKEITLSGPASLVGQYPDELYVNLPKRKIDSVFNEEVPLEILFDNDKKSLLQLEQQSVKIYFEVDEFIVGQYTVPVVKNAVPPNATFELERNELPVIFEYRKKNKDKIDYAAFRAVADFERYDPENKQVEIKLQVPYGVRNPRSATFIKVTAYDKR
ncbi:hypothetical protein [Eisenibacter elegans]|uniref:hypothetical protein n=1 Tax=Eisenibacter elegans TaxID=997 RepID=UPI00041AEC97|nr:hypothetical protein [Eisenibacter elegans]